LIVTSPEFRKIGSDVILLTRDIFADAAIQVADGAKEAAEKSRPSESEKKKGVDFDKLQQKGKSTARHLATGKIQAEARESIWDEVESLKEYVDEKLPAGEEAKERFIERLQAVVKGAQEKPEYKRSITAIVGLFKKYAHKAEDALKETAEKSKVSDEDEKVQQAGRDLKQFIEKVSNKSIDGVVKASQKVRHLHLYYFVTNNDRPPTMSRTTRSSASTLTTSSPTSTDSSTSPVTSLPDPLPERHRACLTMPRHC
jgi:hypothetical protein